MAVYIYIYGYMLIGVLWVDCDQVYQTPAAMFLNPGGAALINCSHSIQGYDVILWYKHSDSKQMQLLGYNDVINGYPEPGLKVKINGSANKDKICTLTVEDLSASSSAVYFCAARYHSASY
uniref:Ig-like domain-containing protein n=1 Tax=Fundulus heteroclitus TaxID=8078 RepID=A0A3Q2PAJ2_FUNHE